jgi:peroxiredoxin
VASLVGVALPDLGLPSSAGGVVNLLRQSGRAVVFVYPYTGRPGFADPEGWDNIPGAHGSTPQALAFSTHYHEFIARNVKVFGVSFQQREWQQELVKRNGLGFALLSDADGVWSRELELESFRAGDKHYLCRRTFVVNDGIITHDLYPVTAPAENAADVLKLLST